MLTFAGDLINEETGLVQSFDLPIEYYFGTDGGESWKEGSHQETDYVSSLPAGRYTMRLEAQWENWNQAVPPQLSEPLIANRIHPDKDVDGFAPISLGRLVRGEPGLVPCTPSGVIRMLDEGQDCEERLRLARWQRRAAAVQAADLEAAEETDACSGHRRERPPATETSRTEHAGGPEGRQKRGNPRF